MTDEQARERKRQREREGAVRPSRERELGLHSQNFTENTHAFHKVALKSHLHTTRGQ